MTDNDNFMQQIENLLRAQAFRSIETGDISLNGLESVQYWEDMGAALASDMFTSGAGRGMSAQELENNLTLLYTQGVARDMGELGKSKRRKKKKKGIVQDIQAPAKEIKKVAQKLSPRAVAEHAKRTARRINAEVKKVARVLAPYIRKIIIAIVVIVIIYYTAGYALPMVIKYLQQRGISVASAGGKAAIQAEIDKEAAKMQADPAYKEQMFTEYGKDPALMADVEALAKKEQQEKKTKTALMIGVPIAALVAWQAMA